jgi:hypothetical protein
MGLPLLAVPPVPFVLNPATPRGTPDQAAHEQAGMAATAAKLTTPFEFDRQGFEPRDR